MKHILRLFPLLLVFCLLLAGCSDPQETETTLPEKEIYGVWYSNTSNATLEIIQNGQKANFYQMLRGCYVYYDLESTTYTYDEGAETLKMTISDEEYLFAFDKAADTLTCEDITYTRKATSPIKHSFPDYSSIDCSKVLKLPTIDAQKIFQYAKADAIREIFKSHYKDSFSGGCPTITDRAAQLGDIVIIDYVGTKDGTPFSGGTATNQEVSISYSNGYIPGFADGIIGHSVGETFDVPVTFPENYSNSPDLAGKEVVFTMTLKTIYDVRLSQEQMSSYILPYDTWEEWVDASARDMLKTIAPTILCDEAEFTAELPAETYLYFYHNQVDQIYAYASYAEMSVEEYLQKYNTTLAAYLKNCEESAKFYAQSYIICHEVAKQEGLTWTEKDYQTMFDSYVANMTKQGYEEAFAKDYVEKHQKKQIESDLICQAVENWWIETVLTEIGD